MRRMRKAGMGEWGNGEIGAVPSRASAVTHLSSRASDGSRGIRPPGPLIPSFPHSLIPSVVALFLAATTACNFAPRHAQPPLPTPSTYDPALNAADGRGPRAAEIGWRQFFRDQRLDAL